MIIIQEIKNEDEKSNICNSILHLLPDWFGVEESIVQYVNEVRHMPFYAAVRDGMTIGFVAVKVHKATKRQGYFIPR